MKSPPCGHVCSAPDRLETALVLSLKIHKFSVEQSLTSLNTSLAGLTTIEARLRLTEFGPNHVEEVEREHLLLGFAREFTHFFAIILWIGATLAFVAEHFDPGQGMASLGLAIIGVIVCRASWRR